MVFSIGFPSKGLAGIPRDVLRRELRKGFALATGISVVSSAAAALVLAVDGAGVWALVAHSVVGALAALVVDVCFARRELGHSLRFALGRREFSELAGFGTSVAANWLVDAAQSDADDPIVVEVLGAVALGLYGLA